MKSAKVQTHKRKGRVVKSHTRKVKGAAPSPAANAGAEMTQKKMSKQVGGTTMSTKSVTHPHRVKGSKAAKAHMAKLRSMRKSKTA